MNDTPGWTSPGSSPSDPADAQDGNNRDENASDGTSPTPHDPPRNWSAEQPPPSSGRGWGHITPDRSPAPTNWGNGGNRGDWDAWKQPPTAKPGVIPLRPLGVGEILDGAVATARAHWRTTLGVALGIAVLVQLASTIATGLLLGGDSGFAALRDNPRPTTDELVDAMSSAASSAGVSLLASLVGTVIATAMLTIVVSRAVLGRSVTTGEAWRESKPRLARLLGLSLLVMLITAGAPAVGLAPGLALATAGSPVSGSTLAVLGGLAGVIVGVWLWVRLCLAAPALMLERQPVTKALGRSAKLVRGNWWRVFGIQLLAWVLVQLVAFIVRIPTSLIATLASGDGLEGFLSSAPVTFSWTYLVIIGIGGVVAMTLTLPLNAGITALLYMDQRIRREALDLELARAAGVTGGDTPPTDPAPGS